MLISATDLSSYLYCPRKLYLAKVLKIREPVKDVMIRGTVMHETFDGIALQEQALIEAISPSTTQQDLFESYKTTYSKILRDAILKNKKTLMDVNLIPGELFVDLWPYVHGEAETRVQDVFSFAKTKSIFGQELWQKLEPKVLSELRIESENLQLKGIVDQIHVFEDKHVPIELKTGRTPMEGVWPSHRIQVGVYALLVGEKFDTPVPHGIVRYLETKQDRPVAMNPFLEMEIKELVQQVQNLLESSEIPDCQEKNKACMKLFPPETLPT